MSELQTGIFTKHSRLIRRPAITTAIKDKFNMNSQFSYKDTSDKYMIAYSQLVTLHFFKWLASNSISIDSSRSERHRAPPQHTSDIHNFPPLQNLAADSQTSPPN
jgi:hypothetical protein